MRDEKKGAGRFGLLALDLDGTLLNDAQEISQRDLEAVKRAASEGLHITLATGRPYPAVAPYARALGEGVSVICYNGALVRGGASRESLLLHYKLHPELSEKVVSFLQNHGLYTKVYINDTLHVTTLDADTSWLCRRFGLEARETGDLIAHLRSADDEWRYPTMITVNPPPAAVDDLIHEMKELFGDSITCHKPNRCSLNIVSGGATKLSALEHLAQWLGIAPSGVLAIGNGDNDCDMLRWAGCGVAVANASPAALAAADLVTADNNNHGVAQALSNLLSWSGSNH